MASNNNREQELVRRRVGWIEFILSLVDVVYRTAANFTMHPLIDADMSFKAIGAFIGMLASLS